MFSRLSVGVLLLIVGLLCLARASDMMGVGGYLAFPATNNCTGGYTGVGDFGANMAAYYGLRASSSTNCATKAVNIRRASDNTTKDILTLANGNFDTSTATTFCNATTCFVAKWYDQLGTSQNNMVQATNAAQPQLIFNCINTNLPCVQFNGSTQWLLAGQCPVSAQPETTGAFTERTGNTSAFNTMANVCQTTSGNGNGPFWTNSTSSEQCTTTASGPTASATDSAWHSFICSLNTTGNFVVDGTNNSASVGSGYRTGNPASIGAGDNGGSPGAPLAGSITEIFFYSTAVSVANMQSQCHNESGYYGTPSC